VIAEVGYAGRVRAPTGGEGSMTEAAGCGARIRYGEFVALVALMTSLVALSIDAMLPALTAIGVELGAREANDAQLILSALFLGLALAQMIYGPLSDSIGRKPAIYLGFLLFIVGCLLSALATSFTVMLLGRFLQGIGAAGPRIVTIAMVRDQYEGRAMARIMSSVMAVFILIPALAPGLGQIILLVASWRAIFGMFLAVAALAVVWFALRQPETLVKLNRAAEAVPLLGRAVEHLLAAGAGHVLLACTELPLAFAPAPHPACIDATEALARSCLAWWRPAALVRGRLLVPPGHDPDPVERALDQIDAEPVLAATAFGLSLMAPVARLCQLVVLEHQDPVVEAADDNVVEQGDQRCTALRRRNGRSPRRLGAEGCHAADQDEQWLHGRAAVGGLSDRQPVPTLRLDRVSASGHLARAPSPRT
jgi:MFS family permease